MMIVHLICETVDLGYHVHSVYRDSTKALEVCDTLNARYRDQKIKDLMSMQIPYTEDQAIAFIHYTENQYFVDSEEVID